LPSGRGLSPSASPPIGLSPRAAPRRPLAKRASIMSWRSATCALRAPANSDSARLAPGLKHQNGPERSVPIAASIEMLAPARKDRHRIEQAALDQALFR